MNFITMLGSLLLLCCLKTVGQEGQLPISIIPEPRSITQSNSTLTLKGDFILEINGDFPLIDSTTQLLHRFVKQRTLSDKPIHRFEISKNPTLTAEAYRLKVTSRKISIEAATTQGVRYAIQSFLQLFPLNPTNNTLPCVTIDDAPLLEYRGLMLDPARHFIPCDELKRYIEIMAQYKFNHLHLHLSDDQGWRVEIKGLPLLTSVGSIRKGTAKSTLPESGFYTQDELKALVKYAESRGVTIVPEIDMPGHSVAAIAGYPELSCEGKQIEVRTTPGVSEQLLCIGNEKVFDYLECVIEEFITIFPDAKFHLGGDEAPFDCWKNCPRCQARMKEQGLKREEELFSYLFNRVNKILERHKKTPLFWFELDVPNYPSNAIMYAWRMGLTPQVIKEAKQRGHKLICAPGEHAYFDYPQWRGDEPQPNWGMPLLSLEQVYKFDPTYGLSSEECDHIIGVEGTLWGECITTPERLYYMSYPRAIALAEAGWSPMERRDWNMFCKKLNYHLPRLFHQGINYRVPIEINQTK